MYRRQMLLSLLNQNTKTVHFSCENGHMEKDNVEVEKLHFQPGEMIDNLKFVPDEGFYLPATIYFGPTIQERTYDSLTGEITFKGPKGNTYIRANGASAFSCSFQLSNCKILNEEGEEINSFNYIPNQHIRFTIIPLGEYSLPNDIIFSGGLERDKDYTYARTKVEDEEIGIVDFYGVNFNTILTVISVIKRKCNIYTTFCTVVDEDGNEKKVWEFVPGQQITLYVKHTTYQYNLPFEIIGRLIGIDYSDRDINNVEQEHVKLILTGGESDADIFVNGLIWDGQIENLYTDILTTKEAEDGLIATTKVNDRQHQVRLVSIDHYDLADGSGEKAHTVWEFANLYSDSSGNFIKKAYDAGDRKASWSTCDLRNYLKTTVYNSFSNELRSKIKTVRVKSGFEPIALYDETVFIASGREMGSGSGPLPIGNVRYEIKDDGTNYLYYKEISTIDAAKRREKVDVNGNASIYEYGWEWYGAYWLRTQLVDDDISHTSEDIFLCVSGTGDKLSKIFYSEPNGTIIVGMSTGGFAFAPVFCI